MKCENDCRDGLVFTISSKDNTTKVYACPCPLGEKHRQPMYPPGDKEKKNPVFMQVWKPRTVEVVDAKSKQFKDNE